jgi:hypothetical protein
VIVVAAAVVVVVSVVGRTGAFGVSVEDKAGQTAPEPHALSVGQHPPPSEAGHDLKLGEHVNTLLTMTEVVEVVVVDVVGIFELVWTTIEELVDSGGGIGTIVLVEVTVVGDADGTAGVMTVVRVTVVVEALKVDVGVGVTKTVAVPV